MRRRFVLEGETPKIQSPLFIFGRIGTLHAAK
jgi:hypothetical protein